MGAESCGGGRGWLDMHEMNKDLTVPTQFDPEEGDHMLWYVFVQACMHAHTQSRIIQTLSISTLSICHTSIIHPTTYLTHTYNK